jgi:hypothetical protein
VGEKQMNECINRKGLDTKNIYREKGEKTNEKKKQE